MKKCLSIGILVLFLLSPGVARSAESDPVRLKGIRSGYPALYRGELAESGPRLLAHFQKSFLGLEPAAQAASFKELEREFETLPPGFVFNGELKAKERLKKLYAIIADRLGQVYYVVSGATLYPVQARAFRPAQQAGRCGWMLTVEIETEWIDFNPPHERSGPPPFLASNRDPDGALAFSGKAFTPFDEFRQTPFQPIRFPRDLPETLKEKFLEEADLDESGTPASYLFNAPRNGFLPLEVTLWSDLLPKNTALTFFYQKKGIWKAVHFPFDQPRTDAASSRTISRFDLNRNGKMEYLVEVAETGRTHRAIYEVDEERSEVFLMTSAPDQLALPDEKDRLCKGEDDVALSLSGLEAPAEKP